MALATEVDQTEATIAQLCFRHSSHPGADRNYPVCHHDVFDVGREFIRCFWNIDAPTVSAHHLKIRCVTFEDTMHPDVSPMVYFRVLSSNDVQLARVNSDSAEHRHRVSRSDPDALLNHGDVLHLTPEISILFKSNTLHTTHKGNINHEQVAEIDFFEHQFHVTDRKLGTGGNASIFVAVKQRTERQVACKIIAVPMADQIEADTTQDLNCKLSKARRSRAREYTVLENLDHPNIIRLEKVICATRNTYIFQELITGGDLLSYLDRSGSLGEVECILITRQVLKAVEYLHDNGVVHRDIKPENILLTAWREGARMVLTDFGQARMLNETKAEVKNSAAFRMHSVVGTYGYSAPEVLKQIDLVKRQMRDKGYSKAVDIWSVACMTGTLLTSKPMFDDETKDAIDGGDVEKIYTSQHWNLDFMDKDEVWKIVGRKAKSFLRCCLVLDEDRRLTAKQALLHVWFTNRHYAQDLEAAYQRAIQNWSPRDYDGDLVEVIDTSDGDQEAVNESQCSTQPEEQLKSQYFNFSLGPPPKPSLFYKEVKYQTEHPLIARSLAQHTFEDTQGDAIEVVQDSPTQDTIGYTMNERARRLDT